MFKKTIVCLMCIVFALSVFTDTVLAEQETLKEKILDINNDMMLKGDYSSAKVELNALLSTEPDNGYVLMSLGLADYGLMDYDSAYDHFKRAGEAGIDEKYEEMLLYSISKIEENRGALRKIEEGNASGDEGKIEVIEGHVAMINGLMTQEYYYPAIVLPHIIWLKQNAGNVRGIHVFSAELYSSASFYEKAAEDYKIALKDDPKNIGFNRLLADCYTAYGDYDNARKSYDKTMELYREKSSRDNSEEIINIRNIKAALPERDEAVADLIADKKLKEAEDICREKIAVNKRDYAAITQLGQVYWEQGKRFWAIWLFRKSIRIAPDYPLAHLMLGRAYVFERKPEKAFREFDIFKKKMALMPEQDKKRTGYYANQIVNIGAYYAIFGYYKEAAVDFKKAIKIDPDNQRARYNLGVSYYKSFNKPSRAYTEFQKVIEIDPSTKDADKARLAIDYMRKNPDYRSGAIDYSYAFEYSEK